MKGPNYDNERYRQIQRLIADIDSPSVLDLIRGDLADRDAELRRMSEGRTHAKELRE